MLLCIFGCFQKIVGKPPKWMVKIMENLMKLECFGGFPIFLVQHPFVDGLQLRSCETLSWNWWKMVPLLVSTLDLGITGGSSQDGRVRMPGCMVNNHGYSFRPIRIGVVIKPLPNGHSWLMIYKWQLLTIYCTY